MIRFVRVSLAADPAHQAVLVPAAAVASDSSRQVLYVVGADDRVIARPVELGRMFGCAKPTPPGTFSHVPPKVWQFAETRDEEVVFEITGMGPTGIDYLNPEDDPRKQK